jgi:hypothetical protein
MVRSEQVNLEDIKAKCPELVDVHWEKANSIYSHLTTIRAPSPSTGRYEKQSPFQMLFGLGDVDYDRLAHVLFYGNPIVNGSHEFLGLGPFFDTLDTSEAQCAANVLDGGGSGRHNTSIYLITWGPQTAYLAGHEDDSIRCGLVIEDWRYVVRTCNIDLDCGEPDLIGIMTRMMLRLPTLALCHPFRDYEKENGKPEHRVAFYMASRTAKLYSRQVARATDEAIPNPLLYCRGLPIRETAALRYDEPRVL